MAIQDTAAPDVDDLEDGNTGIEEATDDSKVKNRGADISRKPAIKKALLEIFKDVETGYTDQWERNNQIIDYWDIYNCKLTSKQFYSGSSKIFVPIVHNAVNARVTRYVNQMFPQSGRYVDVTAANDEPKPNAEAALLEHYIRKAQLRTKVMPALVRSGDVEGQYNIYVSWSEHVRHVTWRSKETPEVAEGVPNPAAEEIEDIKEEELTASRPEVEVISDADILILPQTADSTQEAITCGGSVSILRRWGKAKIRQLIREKVIRKDVGEQLIEEMSKKSSPGIINVPKQQTEAAGVRGDSGQKHAEVYETWTMLKLDGEQRLCQAFYGGENKLLGARRNPLWCDKLPLLSVPVEKVAGAMKGVSKVKPCADLQYAANDAINEAWDSAAYSMMPIVMTDPEKNPRIGSMILSMAAVWETSPKDTQFAQFPKLWQDGFSMVASCKAEIAQTLSVSPAAITQGGGGRLGGEKPTQAEVAQEQQVDILSTADAVTVLEEGILTPMLELFIEMDHQYREEELTVRQFGEMGVKAGMEQVPPIQMDKRYVFRWFGVEQARSAQQIQQQIAGMNVIRGIPPQQLNGYEINLVPIISQLVENTFGPRLAPLIFVSPQEQMPVPADQENQLMLQGFEVPTHKMDDDQQHIQAHMMALQQSQAPPMPGAPPAASGGAKSAKQFQQHIWRHIQQAQAKQQAAMMAQQQAQGAPGVPGGIPGGGPPQPGVAGTPRQGAQPGQPRNQGPPGMLHNDQMQDPGKMPRKAFG